jgi:IS5 family transposase
MAMIKKMVYTPANEHGSHALGKLLTRTEHQLYADKAYASAEHDRFLAKRNQPLGDRQNRQWSSVRCTVGRVSGAPKPHYGIGKARCLGPKRNQARSMLAAVAYNIKRGVAVQAETAAFAGSLRPMGAKRRARAKKL